MIQSADREAVIIVIIIFLIYPWRHIFVFYSVFGEILKTFLLLAGVITWRAHLLQTSETLQPSDLLIVMEFDLFIETYFRILSSSDQNDLTLCQKYHKFRLLSISAYDWQAAPFHVGYCRNRQKLIK